MKSYCVNTTSTINKRRFEFTNSSVFITKEQANIIKDIIVKQGLYPLKNPRVAIRRNHE